MLLLGSRPLLEQHRSLTKSELIEKLKSIMTELQVIDNLNVYAAVYKTFSKTTTKGRKGHYSLILLNSRENTISLKTYSANQFDIAAQAYLDLETKHFNDKQINIIQNNTI